MADRDMRAAMPTTMLAQARLTINANTMFHFVYDSLGPLPQKKISTWLDGILEDGPTFLKMVLDQTFVATLSSTFAIKEKFYGLQLKRYKWNVQMLNQDV